MKTFTKVSFIFIVTTLVACGGSDKKSSAIDSEPLPSSSSAKSSAPSSVFSSKTSSSAKPSSSKGSSSLSASSQASYDTTGMFEVDYGGFTGIYVFLENNNFYGLHFVSSGSTLAGHPHGELTKANSTAAKEHISWANFIDATDGNGFQENNGMFGRTFSAAGVAVSITGLGAAPGVIFNATAKKQKPYSNQDSRSLYKDPIPMETISGKYTGIVRTVGANLPLQNVTELLIASDGTLAVTAMNCTFSGKLLQHESTGVYTITTEVKGSSCSLSTFLKGILIPLSYSNNTLKVAIQLDDLNNSQSAVFIVEK